MEHQSILDHAPTPAEVKPRVPVRKPEGATISARIAAANARLADPSVSGLRFPGEDAGRSLAEMAERDLDAALQLLVDRAQYITGATGAAIALRRGEHNDMLCRATSGSNAPELGALLSMEYGLSGESVRTRQVLRCDDAERDPRVNHEVCRELGIASVVVMPIMRDQQILGIFELLSGKTKAFDDRDISALFRLGQMVETAVSHAVGAQIVPVDATAEEPVQEKPTAVEKPKLDSPRPTDAKESPMAKAVSVAAPSVVAAPAQVQEPKPEPKIVETPIIPKKPLFWSAAMRAHEGAQTKSTDAAVPLNLRNLKKCQACGFPVSQGRTYCVECEEKLWRSQPAQSPLTRVAPKPAPEPSASVDKLETILAEENPPTKISTAPDSTIIESPAVASAEKSETKINTSSVTTIKPTAAIGDLDPQTIATTNLEADNSAPFLGASLQTQSWFASNKYILGALLLVSGVIGAIAWLR
jgi:hypothetical protein